MEKTLPVITIVLLITLAGVAIAFFYNARAQQAMANEARMIAEQSRAEAVLAVERAQATSAFLTDALANSDSDRALNAERTRKVLAAASVKIEKEFGNNPDVLARIRKVIKEARARLETEKNTVNPASPENE